jgi:UDP:flavonoid glycosyltransferase YjiC (YdhE family)
MLADKRYREHAIRIQKIFTSVDGPGASADAIIALASQRGTSERTNARS